MIAISIKLLAGRLHATPWGRHVNEGVPEWPPSPWRLVRTLIATWKGTELNISNADAMRILKTLTTTPVFTLPPATVSHTRHYMPWDKKGPGDTTLIFDTFVAIDSELEIKAVWKNAALSKVDTQTLAEWLRNVGYLGRAESWCEMRLLLQSEAEAAAENMNCAPLDNSHSPQSGAQTEIVRVLCPDPDSAFESSEFPKKQTKLYDPAWHICAETLWLHKERWANPPGSRWVSYLRDSECFKVVPKRRATESKERRPTTVHFTLDSTVLPLITETLPLAEAVRRCLMGIVGKQSGKGEPSQIFSGKNKDGSRRLDHGHAFFLPTDEDNDGRLDHVTLVSSDGFGRSELRALNALTEIKSREREESGHRLFTLLIGFGSQPDFMPLAVQSSADWISATPYLAHRHPKSRGSKRDSPEELACRKTFLLARLREDIARFLLRRPDLKHIQLNDIEITPLLDANDAFRVGVRKLRPIQFKRFRAKRGDDGGKRRSGAFHIRFPDSISGPIALGHSCHFGMGLFQPIAKEALDPS